MKNQRVLTMKEKLHWYYCMPFGVWKCAGRHYALINRALRPIAAFDPKRGLHIPAGCKLFERSYENWNGPLPGDRPHPFERQDPNIVQWSRTFYATSGDNAPWKDGSAGDASRLKVAVIMCEFINGVMPERFLKREGGK